MEKNGGFPKSILERAQQACYKYGMLPDVFWTITPYQTYIWLKAQREKEKQDKINLVTSSYMTSYYSRVKKMPELKKELVKMGLIKFKKPSQSELKQKLAGIVTAFGGDPSPLNEDNQGKD